MLKIWGRTNSVNVKKALWAAEELGLKYERIDAGLQFGVNNTPEYKRINPTGLVPTIDDDGFTLWESHSIVRYLAAKHGSGDLWPVEAKARADADRWMDWTHTFSREFQRPVFWPLVRTPPEKRDAKAIAEAVQKCGELLKIPEQALSQRPYLGGDRFTMGDIPLGCHIQLWMRLPIQRPRLPGVEAWFARLCERPAYGRIVDIALS
ncbi:MAG TPA: glutathione S-transferase [Burkholderiales bacterium]|nr:glutathione S-transferase [Burkholderiales bacterium]